MRVRQSVAWWRQQDRYLRQLENVVVGSRVRSLPLPVLVSRSHSLTYPQALFTSIALLPYPHCSITRTHSSHSSATELSASSSSSLQVCAHVSAFVCECDLIIAAVGQVSPVCVSALASCNSTTTAPATLLAYNRMHETLLLRVSRACH